MSSVGEQVADWFSIVLKKGTMSFVMLIENKLAHLYVCLCEAHRQREKWKIKEERLRESREKERDITEEEKWEWVGGGYLVPAQQCHRNDFPEITPTQTCTNKHTECSQRRWHACCWHVSANVYRNLKYVTLRGLWGLQLLQPWLSYGWRTGYRQPTISVNNMMRGGGNQIFIDQAARCRDRGKDWEKQRDGEQLIFSGFCVETLPSHSFT